MYFCNQARMMRVCTNMNNTIVQTSPENLVEITARIADGNYFRRIPTAEIVDYDNGVMLVVVHDEYADEVIDELDARGACDIVVT